MSTSISTAPSAGSRRRRTEQVALNRDAVLAAARRVFGERGYAASTLDHIAEEAGFSKGVVYSQFTSKADLFLSVLEQRVDERAAANRRLLDGLPDPIDPVALARTFTESMVASDPAWRLAVTEVRVVAARDAALRERYAAIHRRTVAQLAAVFAEILGRAGIATPVPVESIAAAVLALDAGVCLETAVDPASLPVDDLAALTTRMVFGAGAVVAQPARRSGRRS